MLTLYYSPETASFAPHLLLVHMGAPFTLSLVDRDRQMQKSPGYLAMNPAGRIPVLLDGQQPIFESAAICLYLCDKYPEAELFPPVGSKDRGLAYQWLMYLTNTLQAELLMYFYPERHSTQASDAPHIVAAQEARITDMFGLIDRALAGKTYLVGDRLTACDYYLFMLASWAERFQRPPLGFDNLSALLKRLAQLPAMQKVCDFEGFDLSGYR